MANVEVIGRNWWIVWIAFAASIIGSAQSSISTTPAPSRSLQEVHSLGVGPTKGATRRLRSHISPSARSKMRVPVAAPEVQPASVSLENGKLTIQANDSELAQILGSMSALTGMTVKGTASLSHIFGVYGPGAPNDVLAQLLIASSYDFVIAGVTTEGLPRELILNTRNGGTAAFIGGTPQTSASSGDVAQNAGSVNEEVYVPADHSLAKQAEAANMQQLGPGAIAHVPPNEAEGPGSPEDNTARVQQSLQRLRHIQEQQGAPQ